jgi:hypothetical protein
MKKSNILCSAIIILFACACKKSSDPVPAGPESKWTFDGSAYKATGAEYSIYSELWVSERVEYNVARGHYVGIKFASITKPAKSATLTIPKDFIFGGISPDTATCYLTTGNLDDVANYEYRPIGKDGDKVILTVSSTGKLTASFSNISVSKDGGASVKLVSGTIIEK